MSPSLSDFRLQLAAVYALMYVEGQPGYREVTFAESMFTELSRLLDFLPGDGGTELIFRLSDGIDSIKVAELYNVLIWSADARGTIDAAEIQEWFYGKQSRRVEIAAQVDLFPSNSMDECKRILGILMKRFPHLDYLLTPLLQEVDARVREEKAWSEYRRETFEMPKEMTPGILKIIEDIKLR